MPALIADKLGFSYTDVTPLFDDARFHLSPGWTGLVGENGAGKSTLLSLLSGVLRPTSGRVRREPTDARVVTCAQEVTMPPEGLAAFARSRDGADRALLGRLGLEPAMAERWPTLSSGERKRWQIACALAGASGAGASGAGASGAGASGGGTPDILLLDEPGNHLDAAARAWLLDALGAFNGVGVLVAHDRALLDALCDATLRVHEGTVTLWPGGYSAARAAWEADAAERRKVYSGLQAEVRGAKKRLSDARRTSASAEGQRSAGARMRNRNDSDARGLPAQFRADKGAARAGRSVQLARADHERAREAAEAGAWIAERGSPVFLGYEPAPLPWLFTLDAPGVAASSDAAETPRAASPSAPPPIAAPADLAVGRRARIRIAGPNGAGKTTLLRALVAGARIPASRFLWMPQELPDGQGRAWLAELRALPPADRGNVLQLVAALGVDPARLLASDSPSPGEARKLGIALGLGGKVWAAVLDEPTNHLDLPSIERLQTALAAWPGALVLVSHDDTFAAACTDTEWRVDAGVVRT
ncbi:MAG: ATP-binding cassette domain-containing protein [Myxococcota bacterium]